MSKPEARRDEIIPGRPGGEARLREVRNIRGRARDFGDAERAGAMTFVGSVNDRQYGEHAPGTLRAAGLDLSRDDGGGWRGCWRFEKSDEDFNTSGGLRLLDANGATPYPARDFLAHFGDPGRAFEPDPPRP